MPPPHTVLLGHTDRLLLEPFGHGHAEGMVAALADPSVARFIGGPDVTTVEALHARLDHLHAGPPPGRDERWLYFTVRRREDGAIIGRVEATRHPDWAEIAYLIGPAYQRRGYACEATAWLLAQLTAAGVREAWATIHPDNVASRGVLARLGFALRTQWSRPLGSYDPGDDVFMRPLAPA
jgi:RimJ/RimL family protein N-acetyltransferase